MSTAAVRTNDPNGQPSPAKVDMKFEIVVIPVSDVDRAKEFYGRLGWRLDADFDSGKDFRVLQFTPPGSGCSIIFGKNVTPAAPGSSQGKARASAADSNCAKSLSAKSPPVSRVVAVQVPRVPRKVAPKCARTFSARRR